MHGSPGGTQLPSIRSLHPYLPPPPPLATSSMPPHQSNPNPNESDPEVDRDEESAGGGPGNTEPPKKKRRRQALSCSECKRRKIRCDRTQPCAPCVRRGDQAKCQWHIAEPVTERYVPLAEYETLRARVDALEVFVSHLPPDILASMPPLPSQASPSTNVSAASFVPSPSTSVPPIQSLPSLQSLTASSARQASFFAASPPPLQAFPPHVFHSSESGGILPAGAQMQPPGRGGRAPRHSNASSSGSQLPSGSGHGREERASGRQVSGQPHLDEDLGPDPPGAHPGLRSPDQQRTISPLSQHRRVTSPSLSRPFAVPLSTDWTAGFSHGAFTPSPFSPPIPGPPAYPGTSTGSSGFLSPPPSSSGFGSDAPGRRGRGGGERGRGRGGTNASGGPSFQAHSAVLSSLLPSTGSWGDGQTQTLQSRSWSFSSRTSLFLSKTPRLSSVPRWASRSLYDADGLGGGDPGPAVAVNCMNDAGLGLELRVRGKDDPLLLPGLIAAPSHLLSSLLALALEHPGADSSPVLLREANGQLQAGCELGRRAVAICWLPRKRKAPARARRGRRHPKSGRSAR